MSRKFLTNVDLNQNELQNSVIQNLAGDPSGKAGQIYYNTVANELRFYDGGASAWVSLTSVDVEVIEDAVAQLLDAGTGISLDYNDGAGSLTIANTGVTSILGTANQVEASASAGGVTLSLSNALAIGGPLADGSITVYDGDENVKFSIDSATNTTNLYGTTHFKNPTTGNNFVNIYTDGSNNGIVESPSTNLILVADGAIYLGDTSSMNNIVASRGWVTDQGYLSSAVTSIANTDGNISFDVSTGAVTANFANDIDIAGSLTIGGNLTVSGSTTYLNTATLTVEDNIVLLNSNVTGTPSTDAGIEVERGNYTNTSLYWDESANKWVIDVAGDNSDPAVATGISLEGHTHSASDVTDFVTEVEGAIDGYLTGSNSISVSSGSIDTTLATTSYLSKTSGLAVDISSVETQLVTDGFTKKASANVGNGSNTSFAVNHNLGTRDVVVNVYDSSTYETVEVDVVRTNTNTVTVTFAAAPSSNAYRVVVIG